VNVDPHLFVVLGGTGDLMRRKLLRALYHVFRENNIECSLILACGIETDLDDRSYREIAARALVEAGEAAGPELTKWCELHIIYQPIGAGEAGDYRALASRIENLNAGCSPPPNRIFYLALPPAVVPDAIRKLGEVGLNNSPGWTRVVVEKPFGHDLESASELNRVLHTCFRERQIYRIDHYLGKETVQNLLVFRISNAIFEALWNRDRIERVEITVAETLGVEHRAGYYEKAGAVRDMIQNHLTQLLTITAMELPAAFDPEAIRYEKAKVLAAVQPIGPGDVVLGQYTRGVIEGAEVPGYREEPGVAPDSQTETFAALRLWVDNWRWQGVPFYLRTGKRMARRSSQVVVTFNSPPLAVFKQQAPGGPHPNVLTITLQPDEGFDLDFDVKTPGQEIRVVKQRLHFRYAEAFEPLPEAYHTLLLDVMTGDPTLFVSSRWVEASWGLYTPVLKNPPPLHFYPAGSWGPEIAGQLLAGGSVGQAGPRPVYRAAQDQPDSTG
jgi:glucose-6-phosphate 1-dehydrogenase